jgi:Gluconate 2-dehydrogenase subunit 3
MNANDESAQPAGVAGRPAEPEMLSRREASRRLIGMAAIWRLDAAHPVWILLGRQGIPGAAEGLDGTNSKPQFLKMDQLADFASVSEGIVPGSTRALVAPFVDLLLSVDSSNVQETFDRSLAVLGEEAKVRFDATLARLTPSQRDRILASASSAPEGSPQRAAFADLKTWVVGAYYSSEIGMSELGWTPTRYFISLPDCSNPKEFGRETHIVDPV